MPVGESSTYTTTLSVSDIATRVKRQFGDEANVQISDADIIRWINDAQREIAINNELLQNTAVINVLVAQQVYGLPDGILKFQSIRYNGKKLKSLSLQEAEEYVDSAMETAQGEPTYFWIWANELNIYPIPQSGLVDGLKIYYTRQPVMVADDSDVPEVSAQYHNRIVEYCLAQAYELDENWPAAQLKAQQFTEGVKVLKNDQDWTSQDFYPHITSSVDDC